MQSIFLIFLRAQRLSGALAIVVTFLLTACAASWRSVQPGQAEAAIVAKLGQPREAYQLPSGGKRLMWSTQPFGEVTVAADLDAHGKVVRIKQILTDEEFAQAQIGRWSKHDVRVHFGKPAEVAFFPRMNREVWSYRYQENGVWYMLYHFYFSPDQILRSTQKTLDPLHDPDRRYLF